MPSDHVRELITGPFHPTLESALEERIRVAQSGNTREPVLVLVGSSVLARYLPRRLARRMPIWNVRCLTFAQLADMLGRPKLEENGRAPLPDGAEVVLVRDAIAELRGGYFEPVADLPGFARTAVKSIRDLKEAGVAPDALADSRSPQLAAFAGIYRAYQSRLERLGLYDRGDVLAAAAEVAPADSDRADSTFIAYGFYDLTGLQRRLFAAVASAARTTAALVPVGEGRAFDYGGPMLDWLAGEGFEPGEPAGEFAPPVARLFQPPAGEPVDVPVRILSVPGEPREVREIVREVLRLAEDGLRFHEIGVLLRDSGTYSRLLRDAFAQRSIPFFVSGGVPLAETAAARHMLLLADLLAGDMSRADVMQFAHAAPVPLDELIGARPDLGEWELLTIEAGIVSGPDKWVPRLDALARRQRDDEGGARRDAALAGLRRFVTGLLDVRRAIPDRGTWAEITDALLDAFSKFVGECDGRDEVVRAVRALVEIDRVGLEATFDEVREALEEQFDRKRQPVGRFQRGGVFIGDLLESRGLRFRAVIVPGLVEKSFPATGQQDPILLDRDRRRLARPGVHLPLKAARPAEERMLFALALDAATEHRTLTYARLEVSSARERVPSHFLVRLAEAMVGRKFDYKTLEEVPGFERVSMFPSAGSGQVPLDSDDRDLQTVARLIGDEQHDRVLFLADLAPTFQRGVRAELARWQETGFTEFDGLVPAAGRDLAGGEPIAPTRLETYVQCPFRYFVQVVLGIEELEEPEEVERITPLDRGSLVHDILFKGYRDHFGQGGSLSAEALADSLRAAADAVFRRVGTIGPPLTWQIDRSQIARDLEHFARLDVDDCRRTGARPALFEMRFGMPPRGADEDSASTERPLELAVEGHTVRFKGKIDRIDEVGSDGLRVIDYKTGSKGGKTNSLDRGRRLQLPIYLLAADMLRPDRRGLDALYSFATAKGGFATVGFDRATLDERRGDLERIIDAVRRSLQTGVFVARPEKQHCRYCPFSSLCGPNNELIFERKKDDPALEPLLELADIE